VDFCTCSRASSRGRPPVLARFPRVSRASDGLARRSRALLTRFSRVSWTRALASRGPRAVPRASFRRPFLGAVLAPCPRAVIAGWRGGQTEGLSSAFSVWKFVVTGGSGGKMSGYEMLDYSEKAPEARAGIGGHGDRAGGREEPRARGRGSSLDDVWGNEVRPPGGFRAHYPTTMGAVRGFHSYPGEATDQAKWPLPMAYLRLCFRIGFSAQSKREPTCSHGDPSLC
jgi:hypothetical protein